MCERWEQGEENVMWGGEQGFTGASRVWLQLASRDGMLPVACLAGAD